MHRYVTYSPKAQWCQTATIRSFSFVVQQFRQEFSSMMTDEETVETEWLGVAGMA